MVIWYSSFLLLLWSYKAIEENNFETFLKMIEQSMEEYKYEKCIGLECFKLRLGRDLSHFNNGFGRESFMKSLGTYGAVHYQIINHQLYRTSHCFIPARCESIDQMILKLIHDLNDTEFSLSPHIPGIQRRNDVVPLFSHCKLRNNFDVLFPEWSFFGGGPIIPVHFPDGVGDWAENSKKLSEESKRLSWEQKLDKVYFRGSRKTHERDIAMKLSQTNPNLYDAKYVKNQAWRTVADSGGFEPVDHESPLTACKYKYLLDLGTSGCSARTRHSFMCKSLVFRPHNGFEEFWTFALKPWIHYIPINHNNSDIEEKIEFARRYPDMAKKIAINGYQFVHDSVQMKHVYGYWKMLLEEYSKFITWPVVKHENTKLRLPMDELKVEEL